MGQYQTFIVRIWTDGAPSSTRGHIQHIASRRGRYFRDEERMMRFIREFLETAALPAGDGIDRSVPDEPDDIFEDKGAASQ
ncbi:MAG: hypothetical protein ACRDIY_11500 [Chloroflexota bacterium]